MLNHFKEDQTHHADGHDYGHKGSIETAHPDDVDDEGIPKGELRLFSLKYLVGSFLVVFEPTFLEHPSFDSFWKLCYCDEQVGWSGDYCVDGYQESYFVWGVTVNVEGVCLFCQNSSCDVENASIEELKNCHFDEERPVHVGLGEISFDLCHEDQEKW